MLEEPPLIVRTQGVADFINSAREQAAHGRLPPAISFRALIMRAARRGRHQAFTPGAARIPNMQQSPADSRKKLWLDFTSPGWQCRPAGLGQPRLWQH
jgi:hypothetical protein